MKRTGRATIFELADMIGSDEAYSINSDGSGGRAVPLPFYDGLLARCRAAWEVICGRAYPMRWPEPGELERAVAKRTGRREVIRGQDWLTRPYL